MLHAKGAGENKYHLSAAKEKFDNCIESTHGAACVNSYTCFCLGVTLFWGFLGLWRKMDFF
jgi:hypothetical protein